MYVLLDSVSFCSHKSRTKVAENPIFERGHVTGYQRSYILHFLPFKMCFGTFFPYHGSARVLASRPLKMNQATSQIGHILFEFEFELLNS